MEAREGGGSDVPAEMRLWAAPKALAGLISKLSESTDHTGTPSKHSNITSVKMCHSMPPVRTYYLYSQLYINLH